MKDEKDLLTRLLTGDERFTDNGEPLDLTVRDFWSFQFSNIFHDPDEIAEFLVAKALGLTKPYNKSSWTPYDISYHEKRIEVKETAYFHSFDEPGEVSLRRGFDIHKSNSDAGGTGHEKRYERQNDLYVFCLLNGTTPEDAYPLEVSHWEFYVVPTAVINQECGDQKSVSLSRVQTFASPITYRELREEIEKAIDEMVA